MNLKNILIPSLVTGLLAGISEYVINQQLGWKAALLASGLAAALVFLQDLKETFNKSTAIKDKKKKTKLLCLRN